MKTVITFLIAFICVSLFNSWMTTYAIEETIFIDELIDIKSIFIRIIISLLLTSVIIRIRNKESSTTSDTLS
jgi:hypothetical protein